MIRGKHLFFSTDVQGAIKEKLHQYRLCRWTHLRSHRLKCPHVKVTIVDL